MTDAEIKDAEDAMRPVRCPNCGDHLLVKLDWRGRPYMQEQYPVGYECDNLKCAAEWDIKGNPTYPSHLDASGVVS